MGWTRFSLTVFLGIPFLVGWYPYSKGTSIAVSLCTYELSMLQLSSYWPRTERQEDMDNGCLLSSRPSATTGTVFSLPFHGGHFQKMNFVASFGMLAHH